MKLIKNATIVTMNRDREILRGDILINSEGFIEKISPGIDAEAEIIDVEGKFVIPGLIQTHVHLSQTLFRNKAENLQLLDWLRKKIYPYEASHTEYTLSLSARLGLTEMIKTGTTAILDFGTVNHYHVVIEEVMKTGMIAFLGKTLMDKGSDELSQPLDRIVKELKEHIEKYHKKDGIFYVLEPRFVLSCSEELLKTTVELSKEYNLHIHTHTSENKKETELVKEITGKLPFQYYYDTGLTGKNVIFAHAIHLEEEEFKIVKETGTGITHSPSTNLKLGSGIADICRFIKDGVKVGIGADGAPANNNLSMLNEMRLAVFLQNLNNFGCLTAEDVFEIATIGGARLLGIDEITGSIEEEKRADLVVVNMEKIHSMPYDDFYSGFVFSSSPENIEKVFIKGKLLYDRGVFLLWDEEKLLEDVKKLNTSH